MGRGRAPWHDGRRAWTRLNGWHHEEPGAVPAHPDDGDAALKALGDVDLVRGLLDRAEIVAVRTSRRHGKTWAEIGAQLGMTRQAAWDRWHEFDGARGADAEPHVFDQTNGIVDPGAQRPEPAADDARVRTVSGIAMLSTQKP